MVSHYDVCVVTTIHQDYDARIYDRGLKSLVESGFKIVLVSPWKKADQSSVNHDWRHVVPVKSRVGRVLLGFRTFVECLKVDTKVFHIHDIDFLSWAVLLKFIKRAEVIYDCHENYPEEILYNRAWIHAWLRWPIACLTRLIENMLCRMVSNCVVVVPSLYDRFKKIGCNVELIRNFPNVKVCSDIDHNKGLIYIGAVSHAYGMDTLIEIARKLKKQGHNYRITVVDKFKSNIKKSDFADIVNNELLNVEIVERVRPEDLYKIMKLGHIGLSVEKDLPNMHLGYRGKIFEYMAYGVPVIASAVDSNKYLVGKYDSGLLVEPDDVDGFVSSIVGIYNDIERLNYYIGNGYNAINSEFTWHIEREKLIKYVGKLCH